MSAAPPDSVLEQLRWRYATKKFDPAKPVAPELWQALEHALVLSPSSYGLQPWRFVVVADPAVRAKLRAAAWNQPQITDASHLVVFAARKGMGPADAERHVRRMAEVRSAEVESFDDLKGRIVGWLSKDSPEKVDAWAARQVYIALGVFLSAAAMLGVDACPMEGFEPPKFDDILGLPAKGYTAVVLATAGYRADDKYATQAKARFAPGEVIEHV